MQIVLGGNNMPTPHNKALKGEIAKVVLMPGDPNRAQWIADNFLHDAVLVNDVRGIKTITGYTANNKRITVMASGMGQPSMGLYSRELYDSYDVETIIRVGTCGSYQKYIDLKDILICVGSCTDSNWMAQFHLVGHYSAIADYDVMSAAIEACKKRNEPFHVGNILSADIFYDYDKSVWEKWAALGVMGVEMESYALYVNAAYCKRRALTILTVTDNFVKEGSLSPDERQEGLRSMVQIGIDTAEIFAD